jgi:hypothetical protein
MGGLKKIIAENNLTVQRERFIAKGAFQLVVCS